MQAFLLKYAERLETDIDEARLLADEISRSIETKLAAGELFFMEDLGTFERLGEKTFFRPVRGLQEAVNHRFAGLDVIDVANESVPRQQPRFRDRPPELEQEPDDSPAHASALRLVTDPAAAANKKDREAEDVQINNETEAPEAPTDIPVVDADSESTLATTPAREEEQVEEEPVFFSGEDSELEDVIEDLEKLPGRTAEEGEELIEAEEIPEVIDTAEVVDDPVVVPEIEEEEAEEVDALTDPSVIETSPTETNDARRPVKKWAPEAITSVPDDSNYSLEMDATNRPSISRIAVPVIALLGIIGIMLWFINRGLVTKDADAPAVTATEEQRVDPPATPASQPEETAVGDGEAVAQDPTGAGDTETGEGDSSPDATAATTTDPPAAETWNPGGIDRTASGYTIIVSSEPTRSEAFNVARRFAARLSSANQPIDVLRVNVNGQTRFRVGVGQFTSVAVARNTFNSLQSELPDGSWITKISADM